MKTPLETIQAYHQQTKHRFERYAAGPDGLDWNNQPEPFRTFAGSPQLELPLVAGEIKSRYADLYKPQAITAQALNVHSVAALLQLSFGISAWKQHGDTRWALRCNPSSGNLHPTEAYLVVKDCSGIEDGVHHYVSRDHLLEQRCNVGAAAGENTITLPPDSFLVGLSSIHWREAWKYGERAYRYCQHDVGHAIAAMRYAAATLGWQAQALTAWSDADIGAMLGTDRAADFEGAEAEHPDVMLLVTPRQADSIHLKLLPGTLAAAARNGQWQGQANALTSQHLYQWPVIDEVAQACEKPETLDSFVGNLASALPDPIDIPCAHSAVQIIQQRRSAQAFDGVSSIPVSTFYRMLDMTLPRSGTTPWDAIAWQPRIHLLLFVHRVDGLVPGLYLFLRNAQIEAPLRADLSAEFEWVRAEACPAHFRLFRLVTADARNAARALSCHQDIASDGAFSLGMLGEYEAALAQGPWHYRQLFWEAGMLGQVLYLEAEAAGVSGTGIGCYFDDAVHDLIGIKSQALQSIYHFTVGTALKDSRLQTLPAYAHLKRV